MMVPKLQSTELSGISDLLRMAGLDGRYSSLQAHAAGGNNTVYSLRAGDNVYALKHYKNDNRHRLDHEWNFLSAIWKAYDIAPVPKAYAADRSAGLGLYDFIEGKKLTSVEIGDDHMAQVIEFISMLNAYELRQKADFIESAGESGFSAGRHMEVLLDRIERLEGFSNSSLQPLIASMRKKAHDLGNKIGRDEEVPVLERCLSPSDFGFHNALANERGRLTFIDFEYAGWDDPAKMAADFFFQPDIPVPEKYYAGFLEGCIGYIDEKRRDWHRQRAILLRPLFGLRWCCIMLNPFDPVREKAMELSVLEKLRASRLNAAQELLERLA